MIRTVCVVTFAYLLCASAALGSDAEALRVTLASEPIVELFNSAAEDATWCLAEPLPPFLSYQFETRDTKSRRRNALHFVVPIVEPKSYEIRVERRSKRTGAVLGDVRKSIVVLPPVAVVINEGDGSVSSTNKEPQHPDFGVDYDEDPALRGVAHDDPRYVRADRCDQGERRP